MTHLALPLLPDGHGERPLPFFLAMEEWAAESLPPADYFFTWRVAPTVIIGRHQDLRAEVNVDYCRREGIDIVRRKSGGGAVLADEGNIMFSYITPSDEITGTFARFTAMVTAMLRALGIPAEATGRNDITIGGRKVSGNSYYHRPGRSIAHGTMLHSYDPRRMAAALTPCADKLRCHGVKSVPARVTSISEHCSITLEELRAHAIASLTDCEVTLTPAQVEAVEALALPYGRTEWLHCGAMRHSHRNRRRYDGAGIVGCSYSLDDDGRISSIAVSGDFLQPEFPADTLAALLRGARAERGELAQRLEQFDMTRWVPGVTNADLAELIATSH